MKHYLVLIALIFTTFSISAQKNVLRGHIYDTENGQPVSFATIFLKGTNFGATTDIEGFYNIPSLPDGDYNISVTYVGYDTTFAEVKLYSNQIIYKSFYLTSNGIKLKEVSISARKEAKKSEVMISKISVTPKEIKSLPSTGGEPDIAQYLTVIPGIISTGDQGGQIYIRGGSPIQNKILLDGMTIYNPFHSIGLFSVFETETVKSLDVYTGGFGAQYGGRISSIIDIKTREGNRKSISGLVSASPFQAKAIIEGPILKLDEKAGYSASFLFSGKQSLIDQTSKSLYKYVKDSIGLPFKYSDIYGKIALSTASGSKINLFGFNFTDNVNYTDVANINWKSGGGGINFTLVPPGNNVIIDGTVGYSNYEINLTEKNFEPRSSAISAVNAILNFSNIFEKSEVKYGIDINSFSTDFIFQNATKATTFKQNDNNTEIAGFASYRRKYDRIIFEPSLRAQYYASLGEFSFEPRLAAKILLTPKIRLKFSGGLYSQNLISTVNDFDVVNLFVGFLSSPQSLNIKQANTGNPVTSRLQKATHAILGLEYDVTDKLEINIEPYFKNFNQLISINKNKIKNEDADYVAETGFAQGIDLSIKFTDKKWYLMANYSLSKVVRNDNLTEFSTNFDRRHNLNLLATYSFGKNKTWEVSGRYNFGSGFPFTLTKGFFPYYNYGNGVNTNVVSGNPDLGIIFSESTNSGRLPNYHRLDISIKKEVNFNKTFRMDITGSVTNTIDRQNIFYFDRINYKRVDQLPIIPSLTLTLHY